MICGFLPRGSADLLDDGVVPECATDEVSHCWGSLGVLPLSGPTRTVNRVDDSHFSWYEDGEHVTEEAVAVNRITAAI
jgi:hypothetical protein